MSEEIKPGYDRVSQILKPWWKQSFAKVDESVIERKRLIGEEVHSAITCHIDGYGYPLSDSAQPYFDSWLRWYDTIKPIVVKNEQRYYNDSLKITGKVDTVIKLGDDLIVCDWKSTASQEKKLWTMQGAMYKDLLHVNGVQTLDQCMFVKLDKQGEMPMICKYDITPRVKQQAMACIMAYKYFKDE
jgi:hypothetical protein